MAQTPPSGSSRTIICAPPTEARVPGPDRSVLDLRCKIEQANPNSGNVIDSARRYCTHKRVIALGASHDDGPTSLGYLRARIYLEVCANLNCRLRSLTPTLVGIVF